MGAPSVCMSTAVALEPRPDSNHEGGRIEIDVSRFFFGFHEHEALAARESPPFIPEGNIETRLKTVADAESESTGDIGSDYQIRLSDSPVIELPW